ncbi:uncharacterized protein LOC121853905 [Homarus americanus]|nr:uncharacterized protein LOC121853905 [Homarus americanus]
MKSFVVFAVLCLAAFASAETSNLIDEQEGLEEGTPRFGFLSFDNSGATLTFNSTSLQYAVVIGIFVVFAALIIIPLLGFNLASLFSSRDSYGYDNTHYYDPNTAYSTYSDYAKRSLDLLSPVMTALSEAYKKYE